MLSRELIGVGLTLAVAAMAGAGASHFVPTASPSAAEQPGGGQDQRPDIGQMLVEGLRSTPGCLGADIAEWQSGRASVVGWFESKDAVIAWYDHPMHRRFMGGMDGASQEPLAHIPDDQGPIMVVATITPSERPEIPGFPGPISQISIELFAPLPGGAYINGRLSPEGFQVEHFRDLSAPSATP